MDRVYLSKYVCVCMYVCIYVYVCLCVCAYLRSFPAWLYDSIFYGVSEVIPSFILLLVFGVPLPDLNPPLLYVSE